MKSLRNEAERRELLSRLSRLTPASRRLWGRMSVNQMIRHLSDGFRLYLGDMKADPVRVPAPRWLIKSAALWSPFPWPHGFQTMPELDQQNGTGTPPKDFACDVQVLSRYVERFTQAPHDFTWNPHPVFGPLTHREWMRLAYRHCDHHFRQFGA